MPSAPTLLDLTHVLVTVDIKVTESPVLTSTNVPQLPTFASTLLTLSAQTVSEATVASALPDTKPMYQLATVLTLTNAKPVLTTVTSTLYALIQSAPLIASVKLATLVLEAPVPTIMSAMMELTAVVPIPIAPTLVAPTLVPV